MCGKFCHFEIAKKCIIKIQGAYWKILVVYVLTLKIFRNNILSNNVSACFRPTKFFEKFHSDLKILWKTIKRSENLWNSENFEKIEIILSSLNKIKY